jgi:hypothetical protein
MRVERRNVAQAALLLLVAAVVAAAPAAAAAVLPGLQCPSELSRAATVPEGCPCNPSEQAAFGACDSGFVCAQPWAVQVAAAASSARQLLGAAASVPDAALAGRRDGFLCMACSYGQLCPRGSALPPVLSPSIQM